MWYKYTMEYYSALKRNEIRSFVEMWRNLESVSVAKALLENSTPIGEMPHEPHIDQ